MGPAQQALSEILGSFGGALEAVPRSSLGEYRVDLLALDPAATLDALRARGEALCRSLDGHPSIDRAANVVPRVYIRPTTAALWDAVLHHPTPPPVPSEPVLVTFSDPNTNKPLHVGHLRNLFLGSALASMYESLGHPVRRDGTFGDWGVHICQALVAYLDAGAPAEPTTKPDHFVGRFYAAQAESNGDGADAARRVLLALEAGAGPREEHDRLTAWARSGIEQTYQRLGLRFDGLYSETAHLETARRLADSLLASGRLVRRHDGCLVLPGPAGDGDEHDVVVVRPDGTLLVYPQILGIDIDRFRGWDHRIISVFGHQWQAGVGDLLALAHAAELPWVDRYEPVFYGMVRLPTGSMRSRDGNALAADETIDRLSEAIGSDARAVDALRYHLLRQPRMKSITFEPDIVVGRTVSALERALRCAAMAEDHHGTAPEMGAKREALVRRVLIRVDGVEGVLRTAVARRDPAVVLQAVEELVRSVDELPAGAELDPLRACAGCAAERLLSAVGIGARVEAVA